MQSIKYDAEYASEVMTTLPYGYINKNICGIGASSLMLENEENVILVVPSVNLIKNKMVQYPNKRCPYTVLGVYGGITPIIIQDYIKSNKIIKIIVTYDSLPKVTKYIKLYNCRLVIDESNKLLSSSALKASTKSMKSKDVITQVFDIAEQYKDTVTFMSATPTPLKYMPEWISSIPYIDMQWSNTIKAQPILMERGYPYKSIIHEIITPLEESETGKITVGAATFSKAIVFVNSISCITAICREAKLAVKDVGIIAGSSLENDVKIKKYKRLEDPTKLTKYTFVTSAGFEGIDLVDSEAISIILSSTKQNHQMIDIVTDLKQAVSRQRDKCNPNYSKYIYIYNQSIFNKTEEELLAQLDSTYVKLKKIISLWDNAKACNNTDSFDELGKDHYDYHTYTNFNEATQTYTMNDNLFNADKYFILETKSQYRRGFDIKGNFEGHQEIVPIQVEIVTYRDMIDIYNKNKNMSDLEQYKNKKDYYDTISETVRLFNKTWKDLNYAKKMIDTNVSDFSKLKCTVMSIFKLNQTYSGKEIKEILNKVYKQFEISKAPKANDLQEFAKIKIIKNKPSGFQLIEYYK
jgi:hypothetical protein